MSTNFKKLADDQVENFDTEYVNNKMWESLKKKINNEFGSKSFRFLDIGGGNGLFSDRVLEIFPNSTCLLIDNSEVLLSRNKVSNRKTLLNISIEDISDILINQKFNLVCLNLVLHHLVGNDYKGTIINIQKTLKIAKDHLCSDGIISIYENLYDGYIIDNSPSHIIFNLTSCTLIAPLIRKLGANTAGCGVCFLSKKKWFDVLSGTGLTSIDVEEYTAKKFSLFKKVFLNLRLVRVGHFWCTSNSNLPQ